MVLDDRFAVAEWRRENDQTLTTILQELFSTRSSKEWFEKLDSADLPCEIPIPIFVMSCGKMILS
jgi:crotonobetainyl-CoA:carnitine CoA-transferase CaiB-like acyl-CoA transferase